MDQKLLKKFFNGECTDEEVKRILDWVASGQITADIQRSLRMYGVDKDALNSQQVWKTKSALFDKITQDIYGDKSFSQSGNNPPSSHKKLFKLNTHYKWKVAVSVLIISVITVFVFRKIDVGHTDAASISTTTHLVKSTSSKERLVLKLQDGSKVTLNTDSKIAYLPNFQSNSRVIHLEGEAYFEVQKDKNRPFTVIANGIATTAIGTSFNVNSKPALNGMVKVALVEGKVRVQSEAGAKQGADTTIVMHPGEQLSIGYNEINSTDFLSKEVIGWIEGIIYFENVPFEELIQKLKNHYAVDFEIRYKNEDQKSNRYSGEFQNRSLEYILKNLGFSSGFKFQITDNTVMIEFE